VQRTHAILLPIREDRRAFSYHRRIAWDSTRSSRWTWGKFKSVACVMNGATRRHAFVTLATTPRQLHDLFVAHAAEDALRTLVVAAAAA
jgi:hypothetical protein